MFSVCQQYLLSLAFRVVDVLDILPLCTLLLLKFNIIHKKLKYILTGMKRSLFFEGLMGIAFSPSVLCCLRVLSCVICWTGEYDCGQALSVGIFPYVLKLLQTTATDLRQILVFIWTKILALDKVPSFCPGFKCLFSDNLNFLTIKTCTLK